MPLGLRGYGSHFHEDKMFTAILFVCSMLDTNECYKLVDDRGPYKTEQRCVTRIEEMMSDFSDILPAEYKAVRFTCISKDGREIAGGVAT